MENRRNRTALVSHLEREAQEISEKASRPLKTPVAKVHHLVATGTNKVCKCECPIDSRSFTPQRTFRGIEEERMVVINDLRLCFYLPGSLEPATGTTTIASNFATS